MLSLFPSLLTYQMLSPLLVRLVLGAVIIHLAYKGLRHAHLDSKNKILAYFEVLLGILLVIGLFVQGVALIVALILLIRIIGKIQKKAFLSDGINYYLILFVLALTLLVSGAGFLAFDLPL